MSRRLSASLPRVSGVPDLGAYLREQRESAQLSVRQLSKAAGISNPYLSQVERGLRRPSAEILQALAKGLQVSAESLYVRAGLLDVETDSAVPPADARRALRLDPRLSSRQRRVLLDLFDSFVPTVDPPTGGARTEADATGVASLARPTPTFVTTSEPGSTT